MEHLDLISLQHCPSCGQSSFTPYLLCKDHTYSQNNFQLVQCQACSLVFTNPRPIESQNHLYYKSADYISHTNSTKGIIGLLYKQVRKVNLKRKVAVLDKHHSGKQILDIGCGTGFFPKVANAAGYTSIGLEPDPDALKYACETNGVKAYPLEKLNDYQAEFDTVTMWHVLEHVYHLKDQLRLIVKALKPGGLFVIALPNYKSFDGQLYGPFWAGYDVPRHLYHFEEPTIKGLIEPMGFHLVDVLPMKFDAYYVSMLSEKYKGGGTFRGIRNGFRSNRAAARKKSPYSSQIYVFRNKA